MKAKVNVKIVKVSDEERKKIRKRLLEALLKGQNG